VCKNGFGMCSDGTCISVTTTENCGFCGNVCDPTQDCKKGECVCKNGYNSDGTCVNSPVCKAIGLACSLNGDCCSNICNSKICASQPDCDEGLTSCDALTCTNLLNDPNNCGTCSKSCGTDDCIGGVCASCSAYQNPMNLGFRSFINVNFESYTVGNINGQDGWINLQFGDRVVTDYSGLSVTPPNVLANGAQPFGNKSFRMSDAHGDTAFGDQTFCKPVPGLTGESTANPVGEKNQNFVVQFDVTSASVSLQPGLKINVSPDNGSGARMSYLRFEDSSTGINIFFRDVQGATNPANFVETQVASGLDRTQPHNIRLIVETPDGPSNDVVKIYIDCTHVHTGTTWENYYYYDSESYDGFHSRIIDTLIFRATTPNPSSEGLGLLFDNFLLGSF